MGSHPAAHLFAELIQALHDESDALVANDAARLVDAGNRREHLLRLLAPQANALRAARRQRRIRALCPRGSPACGAGWRARGQRVELGEQQHAVGPDRDTALRRERLIQGSSGPS